LKIVGVVLMAVSAALVAAALLFVRPDLPRAELIETYTDTNSSFVELANGSHAHVQIQGPSGGESTVVLLHGAMSSVQSWAGWMHSLSADYRVIAIDLPRHGLTGETAAQDYSRAGMVAFVHAVLGTLGVTHEALVGHSMGGGVAAEYAEIYPNEVCALVLIDASGIFVAGAHKTETALLARNPLTRALLPWIMPRSVLAKGLRKIFGDASKVTDAMVDRIADLERFPGNRRALIAHYLAKSDDETLEAGLSALKIPVLIEWGGVDIVQPIAAGETYRRRIPGARLVIYPGVGHDVIEEAPESSERDAATFLLGVKCLRSRDPVRSEPAIDTHRPPSATFPTFASTGAITIGSGLAIQMVYYQSRQSHPPSQPRMSTSQFGLDVQLLVKSAELAI
jgi:pimeloyl-ACP methyl ester carboxylesterase